MKKIYKKIAKAHGVSVEEVKRDMQEAIGAAYVNPTFHANCVERQNEVPTPDEFIQHLANRVKTLEDMKSGDQ